MGSLTKCGTSGSMVNIKNQGAREVCKPRRTNRFFETPLFHVYLNRPPTTHLPQVASGMRLLAIVACLASTAFAQETGTIYGRLRDPSGAAVAGARVDATIIERGTTCSATTKAIGQQFCWLILVGGYEIQAQASGFQQLRRSPITLDANQNVPVAAGLVLCSITQSVIITADVPAVESRLPILGTLMTKAGSWTCPSTGRTSSRWPALLPCAPQVASPHTFTEDCSDLTSSSNHPGLSEKGGCHGKRSNRT
jgi:hypothetical protein